MNNINIHEEISLWINNLNDKYSMNKIEFKNAKLMISGGYLIVTEIYEDYETSTVFDLKSIIKYKTK